MGVHMELVIRSLDKIPLMPNPSPAAELKKLVLEMAVYDAGRPTQVRLEQPGCATPDARLVISSVKHRAWPSLESWVMACDIHDAPDWSSRKGGCDIVAAFRSTVGR